MNSRTISAKNPPRVIAAAVLLGLFIIGFIVLAIWHSGAQIDKARMTGRIIAKEFVPAPEHQVSLSRRGGLAAENLKVTLSSRSRLWRMAGLKPIMYGSIESAMMP